MTSEGPLKDKPDKVTIYHTISSETETHSPQMTQITYASLRLYTPANAFKTVFLFAETGRKILMTHPVLKHFYLIKQFRECKKMSLISLTD